MSIINKLVESIQTTLNEAQIASSNDKGVLHEILTGKHLNGNKHMSKEAQDKHDEILKRNNITKDSPEYKEHDALAKATADHIRNHFGGDVHKVHWTSKGINDEEKFGVKESQQENPSDLVIEHNPKGKNGTKTKSGRFTGISLKITNKKNGKVPFGNPGAAQTDKQLGTNGTRHYEEARKKLTDKFPKLRGMSKAEMKGAIKANPEIKDHATKLSNEAIGKMRDEWHSKLSKMSTKELSDHIRNNLLHAKKTKIGMYKVTTGGESGDHSVDMEHSESGHDHILNDHKNLTVEKSGNNSIVIKHNGKPFIRHRIKPESTPIATALKGSAEHG